MSHCTKSNTIRCHYDILGIDRNADAGTIKKAYRKLALQYHPDKNTSADDNHDDIAHEFRLIQQAYECLSDVQERKWYDEHRDAILRGWSSSNNSNNNDDISRDILYDIKPYQTTSCYQGYGDDDNGFYGIYRMVFANIFDNEQQEQPFDIDGKASSYLIRDFGTSVTSWELVFQFYQAWESFTSRLSYVWADQYNVRTDAPDRQYRRYMEEENKKWRKVARNQRNNEILAFVSFVKKYDRRVIARREQAEQLRLEKLRQQKEQQELKKLQSEKDKVKWEQQKVIEMSIQEEQDRLAGRIRLADLQDDDDSYEYDVGKKKKNKKKNKNKGKNTSNKNHNQNDNHQDDNDEDEAITTTPAGYDEVEKQNTSNTDAHHDEHDIITSTTTPYESEKLPIPASQEVQEEEIATTAIHDDDDEDEEEEIYRCDICKKDFKSNGQMENHLRSKKHKDMIKKRGK